MGYGCLSTSRLKKRVDFKEQRLVHELLIREVRICEFIANITQLDKLVEECKTERTLQKTTNQCL